MSEGALSAAEVEALLAGVNSADCAQTSVQASLQSALAERVTAWLPEARVNPSTLPEIDAANVQQLKLDSGRVIVCERVLAASLVDFTYGGDGSAEDIQSSSWSVSERRMASRVLELAQAALADVADTVPPESSAFSVTIGRGGGQIAYIAESKKEPQAPIIEFTGLLGYVRLSEATAGKLKVDDLIAFEPLGSILLICEGFAYACRCGSHDNYYAVSIERLLDRLPEPPPSEDGEVLLAVELGRVTLPREESAALTPGTALKLDRPLDAPLRLLHGDAGFAYVEIVELADGLALHVLERT